MDVSKVSDEAIKVLVDWLEMSRKVSDLSDEELAALGMEFASELPIDSPVYVLVDELCERVEGLSEFKSLWQRYLSAQHTITMAGWHDNYTDAARARKRQAETLERAKELLAGSRGGDHA